MTTLLSVSDRAIDRIKYLLSKCKTDFLGIRVRVTSGGCAGFKYSIEYAKMQDKFEDLVEVGGIKIFIDPKAVMFIIGSHMDFVEEQFKAGFVFTNPNQKESCGCGQSFGM